MSKLNLVILGGGNGAHCYAATAAALPDVEVRVLTLFQDEAERWTNAMKGNSFEVTYGKWNDDGSSKVFAAKPKIVSKDPKEVIPGAHIIAFTVPAFAHEEYFESIKPYLEDGMSICGIPGACGFLFQAMSILGQKLKKCVLMSFESLPWACRITEYGRSALIIGGRDFLTGGAMGDYKKIQVLGKNYAEALEYTLLSRPKMIVKGHLLGDTLMYVNAFIHPNIQYGSWVYWDGKPLDEPFDFYHSCNELAAETVKDTSTEAGKIRDAINKVRPDINLSQAIHMIDRYRNISDETIPDKSNLYRIFRCDKDYTGIKHPMLKTPDGKYVPHFQYRYLTEDIPYGQVVLKGIALIVGVETPTLDKVITWAQEKTGKEYLVNGQLTGKDINETRCPQRYGITTLKGILGEA